MYSTKFKYDTSAKRIADIKFRECTCFWAWFLKLFYDDDIFLMSDFNV